MTATPAAPARRAGGPHPVQEFFGGFATLGRGFAFWRVRPGLMALGLVPAAIVAAVVATSLVLLGVFFDPVTAGLTGFAADWDPTWRRLLQLVVGIALLVGTLALAARTFTAITLLIGAPFYDRIQAAADGSPGTVAALGFWAVTGATVVLILQAIGASIVVVLLGLIPAVGSVLAPVVGFVLTALAIGRELTLAPFARRGLTAPLRRRARRGHRARAFGFGVAVQLCYLVPFGAIVTMPAAVAGSAFLARDLLGEPRVAPAVSPPEG